MFLLHAKELKEEKGQTFGALQMPKYGWRYSWWSCKVFGEVSGIQISKPVVQTVVWQYSKSSFSVASEALSKMLRHASKSMDFLQTHFPALAAAVEKLDL